MKVSRIADLHRLSYGSTLLAALCACSPAKPPAATHLDSAAEPVATIQDLMRAEVDASADSIWDSVESISDLSGERQKAPRDPQEWEAVRRNVIVLIEAGNLLAVHGRRVSDTPFAAEAAGALDSVQIEQRIAAQRTAFDQLAFGLRETGRKLLTAVDAHDSQAIMSVGGALEQACEACHLAFWYPNQVIPSWPTPTDPRSRKTLVIP